MSSAEVVCIYARCFPVLDTCVSWELKMNNMKQNNPLIEGEKYYWIVHCVYLTENFSSSNPMKEGKFIFKKNQKGSPDYKPL
jgi:hypothetical protein